MATVNRYTQLTPAQYNPFSLQELMMAPSYMRQQHDAMDAAAAELETLIPATVDPLDIHSQEALKEQERLYNMIDKEVSQLASEGFNSSTKSNFLRLNKEYQKAIAPTGTLGKINAAKQSYDKAKEQTITSMVEAGYSPEDAERAFNMQREDYINRYKETGEITTINPFMAPNFRDPVEEFTEKAKLAGVNASDIISGTSNIITEDERGIYVLNENDQTVTSSNKEQLQSLVDYMNVELNNPDSETRRSLELQGRTIDDVQKQIRALKGALTSDTFSHNNTKRITNFNPLVDGSGGSEGGSGTGLTYAATEFTVRDVAQDDYRGILNKVSEVMNNPDATPEQKVEAQKNLKYAQKLKRNAIALNPQAANEFRELEIAQKQIVNLEQARGDEVLFNAIKGQKVYDGIKGEYTTIERIYDSYLAGKNVNDNTVASAKDEAINRAIRGYKEKVIPETEEKLQPILEKAAVDTRILTDRYTFSTTANSKQKSALSRLEDDISRLSNMPGAIQQLGTMTEVRMYDPNNPTSEEEIIAMPDKDESLTYAGRFQRADNVKPIGIAFEGTRGKPELTIQGSVGTGSQKRNIVAHIEFDDVIEGQALNALGEVSSFIASGSPQGAKFADKIFGQIAYNSVRDEYRGQQKTWGDVKEKADQTGNRAYKMAVATKAFNHLREQGYHSTEITSDLILSTLPIIENQYVD